MARGQEVLGYVVLMARQQFASLDPDQLDGDTARLVLAVAIDVGIAVGEPDQRREGPRRRKHAVTGMFGKIAQNLKFGDQSRVDLGVEAAERSFLVVGIFFLVADDVARKITE